VIDVVKLPRSHEINLMNAMLGHAFPRMQYTTEEILALLRGPGRPAQCATSELDALGETAIDHDVGTRGE